MMFNFTGIKRSMKLIGQFLVKYMPEIMTVTGTLLTIGGTVWIAIEAVKIDKIVADMKAQLASLTGSEQDKKTAKEIKKKAYKAVARLLAAPVGIEIAGYCMIYKGHAELMSRVEALSAGYLALDKAYNEYRERVKDQVGEETEKNLYNGKRYNELGELIQDYGGPATPNVIVFSKIDPSTGKRNPLWSDDPIETIHNIKEVESKLDSDFHKYGFLMLNHILRALKMKQCKEGQIMCKIRKKEDEHFSFNLPLFEDPKLEAFRRGEDDGLRLFVELDGPCLDQIPEKNLPSMYTMSSNVN